jgi:hypothetical protein
VEHDEIRAAIPTWAAGRMHDPAARRRLEAHLAECTTCADVAATSRILARAIERDGAALFEAHPDTEELRRQAQGIRSPASGERDREIARHVASCASCTLELGAWQAAALAGSPVRRRPLHWRDAGFAAAGLAAGLLLGLLAPGTRPARPEASVARAPVSRILLQSAVRGLGNPPEPALVLSSTEGATLFDAAFQLPAAVDRAASLRFEIREPQGRVTWAATEPVSRVAQDLARHELVGFLVPDDALSEGAHVFEVSVESSPSPALLSARFQVRRLAPR